MINWLAMYWSFEGKSNEKMHVVVEAETRGWVGLGFGDSDLALEGAEVVVGWIAKSDLGGSSHDATHLGSYRLSSSKGGWKSPVDYSKVVKLEGTSVCQTREGRTVLRFTRKTNAGKFPIEPWVGSFAFLTVAVGDVDEFSEPVDHAEFSITPWQSKIGPEEPEGWSFRWIFTYSLLVFHIFTWFIR